MNLEQSYRTTLAKILRIQVVRASKVVNIKASYRMGTRVALKS